MDRMGKTFRMMRQLNGSSTPAPRFSVAKQSIVTTRRNYEEEEW